MNPMKEMLEAADEYAKQSTWKDFALIKACLGSMGIMIGLGIPENKRKAALAGASVIFTATWLSIMIKFLPIVKDHLEKE